MSRSRSPRREVCCLLACVVYDANLCSYVGLTREMVRFIRAPSRAVWLFTPCLPLAPYLPLIRALIITWFCYSASCIRAVFNAGGWTHHANSSAPSPHFSSPPAISQAPPNPGTNLFVTNLAFRTNEDDLRSVFDKYGEIVSCRIVLDPLTKESRYPCAIFFVFLACL